MKIKFLQAVVAGLILSPCISLAQAPAGAPAGTTGKCKDGTFTSAPKKQGACRGHKGIDTWYAADAAPAAPSAAAASSTPAPAAKSSSSPAPAASPAPSSSSRKSTGPKTPKTAAPGGAPGLVWVNSSTNVYHCYGTQFYGTTKAGKYMSEAEAKAAGARPDRNKACSAK
ncbi:MAG: signal peptide protein [Acidobacteria bacterium]|nr:signal peptide protein [Acidobacteriota bacterium]